MTINIKILSACCAAAVLMSCVSENIGTEYSGTAAGFGFSSTVVNAEVTSDDNNRILVPVNRGSFDEGTAQLSFEFDTASFNASPVWLSYDPDGVFSLLTPKVIFSDNSYTAYAQVRFSDIEKMGVTDKYRIRLTIQDNLSPSNRNTVIITVNRKLSFEFLGEVDYLDACIFEKAYTADIYKANEADVYRVMDPYTEGLIAEDYSANGWMGDVPAYVQFVCDDNGHITYDPFPTGMLVRGLYLAYAYYPGDYQWGKDFSSYNEQNKVVSDTEFQLYPVYCLPSFQYGFLNEGAYPLTITLKR